ncbi:ABC transporter permease [Actinotalea sp. BY-33]|uniref:ABC transporter permease n=1 Tax=Actinotalea soli TaxID=2819234 RepID=A0A939LNG0_9CELL|nr:ABC transporter permease [Actinotalea soli]MBO1751191.1 ABC transporter permease [Actinotalea soli]
MSPTTEAHLRAPGLRAWMTLTGAEVRMVVRDTAGLLIPVGLPLLILVMNALGETDHVLPGTGGRTVLDIYVLPLVLTMVIAVIGVVNMPSFLAYYRRTGVLRRLAVTPAHPSMVLVAQVLTSLLQAAVGIGLALTVAVVGFGANLPARPGVALALGLLAAAAMYALGVLVAAVAPSGNAAVAMGLVLFFGMGATGGMFGPTTNLPDGVARVGEVLPFGATVEVLGTAWAGGGIDATPVLALAATTLVCSAVGARFFRWQ